MSMRWIALLGIAFVAGITLKNIEGLSGYRERLSYALGMHNWNRLQNQSVEVDPSAYISGFLDARSGSDALLSEAEVRAILGDIPDEPDGGGLQAGAKLRNLQRGEQPLLARHDVDGFTALESGLRYRILETGAGDRPTLEDMVVVQYRGTRLDGTELDSTYRRGKPVIFAVRQLIPGLREALQRMAAGSRWQLLVPPGLAHGDRVSGGPAGTDATIILEVELLAITGQPGETGLLPAGGN